MNIVPVFVRIQHPAKEEENLTVKLAVVNVRIKISCVMLDEFMITAYVDAEKYPDQQKQMPKCNQVSK